MTAIDLAAIHKEIIHALISLYKEKKRAIRGEGIAEMVHRNPGTIRNQMQILKSLGLVDGTPGPKGGIQTNNGGI